MRKLVPSCLNIHDSAVQLPRVNWHIIVLFYRVLFAVTSAHDVAQKLEIKTNSQSALFSFVILHLFFTSRRVSAVQCCTGDVSLSTERAFFRVCRLKTPWPIQTKHGSIDDVRERFRLLHTSRVFSLFCLFNLHAERVARFGV